MRIKIPLTGTVKSVDPCIVGEEDDIIRPLPIMGNVEWTMISLDLENEEMEIEIISAERASYDTGQVDGEGKPIFATRPTTPEEREAMRENARNHSLERMSKQALYALAGLPALKNPFKEKVKNEGNQP